MRSLIIFFIMLVFVTNVGAADKDKGQGSGGKYKITAGAVELAPKKDAEVATSIGKYTTDLAVLDAIIIGKFTTTAQVAAALKSLAEIEKRNRMLINKMVGN